VERAPASISLFIVFVSVLEVVVFLVSAP
jgi:hypothetical protein